MHVEVGKHKTSRKQGPRSIILVGEVCGFRNTWHNPIIMLTALSICMMID